MPEGRVIWVFTEEDLAYHYTKAACPQCRTGADCEEQDEHEGGGAYWMLPESQQDELYHRATRAMNHSTVGEVGADVLVAVAEASVDPEPYDPLDTPEADALANNEAMKGG